MDESRFRLTTNDGRCLVHQVLIGERFNHEKREIGPSGQITRQNGVTNMPAPERRPLTRAFFEVTSTHHRPSFLAIEDSSARFFPIADLHKPEKLSKRSENRNQRSKLPRVPIFAIPRDVPAA